MTQTPNPSAQLSQAQNDLIARFLVDYNEVDRFLKSALNLGEDTSFSGAVREYARSNPRWRYRDLLLDVARVRNVLEHGKGQRGYPAVPAPALAQELHACRDALLNPEPVTPKFQRAVTTLTPDHSLAEALQLVREHSYSQFPVYADKAYQGLLTENGITRWLAAHVSGGMSLVELQDAKVGAALQLEEKRRNCDFLGPQASVDDLRSLFYRNSDLEAVLITHSGKRNTSLIGIASRWDIAGLA